MKFRTYAMAMAVSLTTALSTHAATLLVNGAGQLTGATDVTVLGSIYDVEFVDGTCFELFDGCDAVSDFDFTTEASARSASQSLLDQVFIGEFDDDPSLTLGNSNAEQGRTLTPYGFLPSGSISAAAAENRSVVPGDFVFVGPLDVFADTTDFSFLNWARWTYTGDVVPAVPLPAGGLLLLTGLLGVAGLKYRKNQAG